EALRPALLRKGRRTGHGRTRRRGLPEPRFGRDQHEELSSARRLRSESEHWQQRPSSGTGRRPLPVQIRFAPRQWQLIAYEGVQGGSGRRGEDRAACEELPEYWAQSDTLTLEK